MLLIRAIAASHSAPHLIRKQVVSSHTAPITQQSCRCPLRLPPEVPTPSTEPCLAPPWLPLLWPGASFKQCLPPQASVSSPTAPQGTPRFPPAAFPVLLPGSLAAACLSLGFPPNLSWALFPSLSTPSWSRKFPWPCMNVPLTPLGLQPDCSPRAPKCGSGVPHSHPGVLRRAALLLAFHLWAGEAARHPDPSLLLPRPPPQCQGQWFYLRSVPICLLLPPFPEPTPYLQVSSPWPSPRLG